MWRWTHHCSEAQNAPHSSCSCLSCYSHNLTPRTDWSCSPYCQEMILCQSHGQGLDPPLRLACMGKCSLHLLNVNFSKLLACLWSLLVFYKMGVFAWCCLLHWDLKKKKKRTSSLLIHWCWFWFKQKYVEDSKLCVTFFPISQTLLTYYIV